MSILRRNLHPIAIRSSIIHIQFVLCAIICVSLIGKLSAQVTVDCNSHRFDQEVFSSIDTSNDVLFGANLDYNGINTDLTMDIYQPSGDTMSMRPLIIWAHGGSFISGTKNDVDVVSLSQHFAKRGYVCVSINYRLGINFPYNQLNAMSAVYRSVQDMKAAIRFFREDAATANTYKIDPNVIIVGGSSAGAFAALHTAYLNTQSELPIALDTVTLGNLEGTSGHPGYPSTVSAVVDLCGALGSKTMIQPGDVPFVAMHGNMDQVVPYATAVINLLGAVPIMVVDGSYSIAQYGDSIGVRNAFYTFYGADHVPFVSSTAYMDTTVRFVSNFLYQWLGCTPADPNPLPNTFTTGIDPVFSDNDISIYPNPSSGQLFIDLKNDQDRIASVKISDLSGRIISEKNSFENPLLLKNISPGIYLLQLKTKDHQITKKIILE